MGYGARKLIEVILQSNLEQKSNTNIGTNFVELAGILEISKRCTVCFDPSVHTQMQLLKIGQVPIDAQVELLETEFVSS